MNILTVIFGIISIIGVSGTFYYGYLSQILQKRQLRFSWQDVFISSLELGKYIKRKLKPEILINISGPSGIITNLIIQSSNLFIPVFTIILEKKDDCPIKSPISDFIKLETTRWNLYIPSALINYHESSVCLIDDAIISGDSINCIKSALINLGFQERKIFCCSMLCSSIAILSKKCPDKYIYKIENDNFYLPWGKGY